MSVGRTNSISTVLYFPFPASFLLCKPHGFSLGHASRPRGGGHTCSRESAAPGKREGRLEKSRGWTKRFMGVEVGVPYQGAWVTVAAI